MRGPKALVIPAARTTGGRSPGAVTVQQPSVGARGYRRPQRSRHRVARYAATYAGPGVFSAVVVEGVEWQTS